MNADPTPPTPITWLSVYRQREGMSQAELAEASEVTRPNMSRYERGVKQPGMTTARRIAKALGVSVDALFPDDDVPTPMEMLAPHMEKRKKRRRV